MADTISYQYSNLSPNKFIPFTVYRYFGSFNNLPKRVENVTII